MPFHTQTFKPSWYILTNFQGSGHNYCAVTTEKDVLTLQLPHTQNDRQSSQLGQPWRLLHRGASASLVDRLLMPPTLRAHRQTRPHTSQILQQPCFDGPPDENLPPSGGRAIFSPSRHLGSSYGWVCRQETGAIGKGRIWTPWLHAA